jgi:hypothetical protein
VPTRRRPSLQDGKLRDESELAYYDVVPDTLQPNPSPNNTLTLDSKEIADW